jgi:hypothetical protein
MTLVPGYSLDASAGGIMMNKDYKQALGWIKYAGRFQSWC